MNLAQLVVVKHWQAQAFTLIPKCPLPHVVPYDLSILDALLRHQPAKQRLWLLKGRFEWLDGDCQGAAASWHTALDLKAEDPVAQLLNSIAQYTVGLAPKWDDLLAPAQAQSYAFRMGMLSYTSGDRASALTWFSRAHSIVPERRTAELLADLYHQSGQPILARQAWELLAASRGQSDVLYWWSLGKAEEMVGSWQAAVTAYSQGLSVASDKYELLMQLGTVLEHIDLSKSATFYHQALKEHPESIWPRLGLGHIALNSGDYQEASGWYTQAAKLAPDDVNPRYYLGVLAFTQGDCMLATEHLKDALVRMPTHSPSLYLLAHCSYRAGDLQQARSLLASAIQANQAPRAEWTIELGDWYAKSNLSTEALTMYEQALKDDPGSVEARSRIDALQAKN